MLSKLTIVHKILLVYVINIFLFTAYMLYTYTFTQGSINQLEKTVEQQLPLSQLYTKNYELLDDIILIFTDTVLTFESDMLHGADEKKLLILENFSIIKKLDENLNTQKQKELFLQYYKFAYSFTQKLLSQNNGKDDLRDMIKLQKLSKETIAYFEKQKELSSSLLVESLEKISTQTSNYFNIALFLAVFGLVFMSVTMLTMHGMLKGRFKEIIESVKNLALAKPDFSKRLDSKYDDEIGEIVKWFNSLQSKLEVDYNQLDQLKRDTEQSLEKEIEDTQVEVVFTMGSIGETRSKETGNHVKRVAEYSKLLALHYGLPEYYANMLKQASPMHDIGKVAIPDAVLNKPGRFDEAERRIMDTHSQLGYEMLKNSNRPLLNLAATVAYEHHEKWDGSGYPRGLVGDEIDIGGRITALADVFDALGSNRIYKKAWDDEKIFAFFKEQRGKHFEPLLVDIFFDNLNEFLEIRDKFEDNF